MTVVGLLIAGDLYIDFQVQFRPLSGCRLFVLAVCWSFAFAHHNPNVCLSLSVRACVRVCVCVCARVCVSISLSL